MTRTASGHKTGDFTEPIPARVVARCSTRRRVGTVRPFGARGAAGTTERGTTTCRSSLPR